MKRKRYIIFMIIYTILLQSIIVGCNHIKDNTIDNVEIDKNKEEQALKLENGAYIKENSEKYSVYNKEQLAIVDTTKAILNYNKEKQTYVFNENGTYFVNYEGENYKITDKRIYNIRISPNGEYLLYFVKEEFLVPKIYNIKDGKEEEIANNAMISGQYIDWIDNNICFYGVDNEEKVAGIFIHNIITKEEKCIYKVENGFIEYFQNVGEKIIFVEEKYDKNKLIKSVDISEKVEILYENSEDVYDVEITEEGLFILGKIEKNLYSLYKISAGEARRLVFDFPYNINFEKGISKGENGEILFVGSNMDGKEEIYSYHNETISTTNGDNGNFNFININ